MNMLEFEGPIPVLTLDTIAEWLIERASNTYSGKAVTQLEHALQCAALAQADGATPQLITAALLHDIGHLADHHDDTRFPHEKLGAEMLRPLFGDEVAEPVRLNVYAKRFLCTTEAAYWSCLSDMSRQSLIWQGGPLTAAEAIAFVYLPHAHDAIRLREWDDAAQVAGAKTPPLEAFLDIMVKTAQITQLSMMEAA